VKTGKIKFFNSEKKFGFIADEERNKYFFHISNFKDEVKELNEGSSVKFDVQKQKFKEHKGSDIAVNIELILDEHIEYFKNNVLELDYTNYDLFCDNVKAYAEKLKSGKVTTSMMRNVYSRIMNSDNIRDLKVLRPRFAYISGRNEKNNVLRSFMELLDYLVKNMNNQQHIENFKRFMEAIVAYRKYVGSDQ